MAHVLWGQFNKFSGNNAVGHSVPKQTLALKPRRAHCHSETRNKKTHRLLILATLEMLSPSALPQPLCTPKTLAPPPPICPAPLTERPHYSRRLECRDVGVPVGTLFLPVLGGGDLPPGGSRWSPRSRGFMADGKVSKVNEGHSSWTVGRKHCSKRWSNTL